jgi:glycosyltransferase involved in cell wall biosynthesis
MPGAGREQSKVQLAYLIGHLKVGGTQQHLYEIFCRLDRTRYAPRVYCLKRSGEMVAAIERLGVPVVDLGLGDSLRDVRSLKSFYAFVRRLRREHITLLHCYLPRASFFGIMAGKLAGVPVVLVSKRSLEPHGTLAQRLICRLSDAWAHTVLVNSQEVWRHAVEVEGCPPAKLRLMVNGINLDRYSRLPAGRGEAASPVVGTVLRLEPIKGPETFIAAAGRIASRLPKTRFVIVGDGSLRPSLERRVAELGLADRLQFLGERSDIAELLSTMSVFVLPSLVEGMSMALLEAMAAARPIVATRVGGNVNLIREAETGLLVSVGNPDEMADAVVRLLTDRPWARQLGHKARSAVVQDHSADRMVQQLETIYQECLGGPDLSKRCH